jgi:hypothetical protein
VESQEIEIGWRCFPQSTKSRNEMGGYEMGDQDSRWFGQTYSACDRDFVRNCRCQETLKLDQRFAF